MFCTGMFNGLKKIVGKNADDTTNVNCQQSSTHSTELNMAPNKCRPYSVKKRKITDKRELLNMKKKYKMIRFFLLLLYVIFVS